MKEVCWPASRIPRMLVRQNREISGSPSKKYRTLLVRRSARDLLLLEPPLERIGFRFGGGTDDQNLIRCFLCTIPRILPPHTSLPISWLREDLQASPLSRGRPTSSRASTTRGLYHRYLQSHRMVLVSMGPEIAHTKSCQLLSFLFLPKVTPFLWIGLRNVK